MAFRQRPPRMNQHGMHPFGGNQFSEAFFGIKPEDKKSDHASSDQLRAVEQLEEDGFYSNPHRRGDSAFKKSEDQYRKQYCYDRLGHLKDSAVFISPLKIVNNELQRLKRLMERRGKIRFEDLRLLGGTIGLDYLTEISRIVDQKKVIEVRSKDLGRTFYSVQSIAYEQMMRKKGIARWLKRKKAQDRKRKRKKQRDKERLEQFKSIEVLDGSRAAHEWVKKQKEKENAEWRRRFEKAQERKRKRLEMKRKRKAERAKTRKKRKVWPRRYPVIRSCQRQREYRRKMARREKRDALEDEMEMMSRRDRAAMRWKIKTIRKEKLKDREQRKTVQKRMALRKLGKREKVAAGLDARKPIKYRVIKMKPRKRVIPKYNVFLNPGYCECNQFRHFLRRAQKQTKKAREIELEMSDLGLCKHIFAVKLALIFNRKEVHEISEQEWSRRSLEHISNNIPPSLSAKYKRKRKKKKW